MPFRLKALLGALLVVVLAAAIAPLVVPINPPAGVRPLAEVAGPDARYLGVKGVELHVERLPQQPLEGAPTIVMVHGFPRSTYTFHALAPLLADAPARPVNTVAFDLPGFGLSERPRPPDFADGFDPYTPAAQVELLTGVLGAVAPGGAIVLGHGSGARLALDAAMAAPSAVTGLVLIGGTLSAPRGRSWLARLIMRTPQMQRLGPVFLRQLAGDPGLTILRAGWADPTALDDATVAAYRRAFTVEGWDTALWQMSMAEPPSSLDGRVGGVNVPVLVLAGADDRTVPVEESERIAAQLPNATLRLLDGCGHYAQEECPEQVQAAIEEWLRLAFPR